MTVVKIGPYLYTVQISNAQVVDGFDHERWGDIRNDKLRIRIHEQAVGQIGKAVLMHECIHAMEFLMGQEIEEKAVRALAPLIVGFLEENGVDLSPLEKVLESARKAAK